MNETTRNQVSARNLVSQSPSDPRIVVLGVGNILRCDEGIGVRVVEALRANYSFPPNVHLVDGGTAGLRLSPLMESADYLIIVDAVQTGALPGSIFVFTPETVPARLVPRVSAHELGPLEALALLQATGAREPETVIIGIEPEDLSPWIPELSPTLRARLPQVVQVVLQELARLGVTVQPLKWTSAEAI